MAGDDDEDARKAQYGFKEGGVRVSIYYPQDQIHATGHDKAGLISGYAVISEAIDAYLKAAPLASDWKASGRSVPVSCGRLSFAVV